MADREHFTSDKPPARGVHAAVTHNDSEIHPVIQDEEVATPPGFNAEIRDETLPPVVPSPPPHNTGSGHLTADSPLRVTEDGAKEHDFLDHVYERVR
ncbi:hypothetical protein HDU93_004818, partial [Gonapodya sp. JEL0774]